MSATLAVRGLSAGYGGITVIDNIDLEARAGRLTVILGPNGAGKTTLLRAISGLIPRRGAVTLDGIPLPVNAASVVARGLAHVAEGRELFPQMTVRDNLELGAWLVTRAERAARLDRTVAIFPKLGERARQLAGSLSGGEQQMLAIGRALMGRPRLLMLDEPSLGLAPRLVDEVFAIVRRLPAEGVSVLLVEQNVAKAVALADDACVLERGRIVLAGPARAVLDSERIRAAYLGTKAVHR